MSCASLPDPVSPFFLRRARVHEVQDAGRIVFALWQAMQHEGPIFLIFHHYQLPKLMEVPHDVHLRLHLVAALSEDDLLWATEEALRAAPVGLVIAQPQKPLSLTIGRRLQLAAEAGQTTGLVLIREGQGSNAAETRWQCKPIAGEADSTRHHWQLIKNKRGTCGEWIVNWDGKTPACHMAQEAAVGSVAAPSSGGGALRADSAQGPC